MKKQILMLILVAFTATMFTACSTVDSKDRGICVSFGGSTDTKTIYTPGMHWGLHWLADKMVTYDVSQQTIVEKYGFNDANNMETGVELSLDFNLEPAQIGLLHVGINDWKIKLQKTMKSAAKEVISQYSASDLNLTKRNEAENKLAVILTRELPQVYIAFARVQITDVDIPTGIAQAAEQTAKQAELNKLALSKGQEAENNYKAAEWDAKTKDVLSQPAMLKLKELEIQMEYAKKGVSPYGTNNVFGTNPALLLNR
jgi:hypothetical protein